MVALTLAIAVAAIASLLTILGQREALRQTDRALELSTRAYIDSQRARIGIRSLKLMSPSLQEQAHPGHYLDLFNSGESPATRMNVVMSGRTTRPITGRLETVKFDENDLCETIELGGRIVYPEVEISLTWVGNVPITKDILNLESTYYVIGCIIYVTMENEERISFCYYYDPGFFFKEDRNKFRTCDVGQMVE